MPGGIDMFCNPKRHGMFISFLMNLYFIIDKILVGKYSSSKHTMSDGTSEIDGGKDITCLPTAGCYLVLIRRFESDRCLNSSKHDMSASGKAQNPKRHGMFIQCRTTFSCEIIKRAILINLTRPNIPSL